MLNARPCLVFTATRRQRNSHSQREWVQWARCCCVSCSWHFLIKKLLKMFVWSGFAFSRSVLHPFHPSVVGMHQTKLWMNNIYYECKFTVPCTVGRCSSWPLPLKPPCDCTCIRQSVFHSSRIFHGLFLCIRICYGCMRRPLLQIEHNGCRHRHSYQAIGCRLQAYWTSRRQ